MTAVGDWFYYVTDGEQLTIVGPRDVEPPPPASEPVFLRREPPAKIEARVFEPLPRKVLQAVHVDAARALIASASWSEVAVHRIAGNKLEPVRYLKTTGNVGWVALGGPYVAIYVKGGADGGISVRRLDDGLDVLFFDKVTGNSVAIQLKCRTVSIRKPMSSGTLSLK